MREKKDKGQQIVPGVIWRILADILDSMLLMLFGFLLAIPLKSQFYKMGENGVWIGIFITFLYTGILQSWVGNGQSVAKMVLKMQVLRMDGSYLSLPRSFLRYAVIAFIFCGQWVALGITSIFPVSNIMAFYSIFGILAFFLLIATIVLVALHPQRRGPHDMLAGSIVVWKGMYDAEKLKALYDKKKTNKAVAVLGLCCCLYIVASYFIYHKAKDLMPTLKELVELKNEIENNTQLTNVAMSIGTTYRGKNADGTRKKIESIMMLAFLNKSKFDDKKLHISQIEKAIDIIIKSHPKITDYDYINVAVRTGYNIGIASFYQGYNTHFTTDGVQFDRNHIGTFDFEDLISHKHYKPDWLGELRRPK